MLCLALENHADDVVGVVQLYNYRPRQDHRPTLFNPSVGQFVAPNARVLVHSIDRTEMLEQV